MRAGEEAGWTQKPSEHRPAPRRHQERLQWVMESLEMEGAGAAEGAIGPGVFCFVFFPQGSFSVVAQRINS